MHCNPLGHFQLNLIRSCLIYLTLETICDPASAASETFPTGYRMKVSFELTSSLICVRDTICKSGYVWGKEIVGLSFDTTNLIIGPKVMILQAISNYTLFLFDLCNFLMNISLSFRLNISYFFVSHTQNTLYFHILKRISSKITSFPVFWALCSIYSILPRTTEFVQPSPICLSLWTPHKDFD